MINIHGEQVKCQHSWLVVEKLICKSWADLIAGKMPNDDNLVIRKTHLLICALCYEIKDLNASE